MGSEATWTLLPLLGGLAAVALTVAALARDRARRAGMTALALGQVAAGLMVISSLVDLTPFQRGEILVTASGISLLVAGHAGWRKERGVADPSVSTCLAFGSLMAIVPVMFEILMLRTGFQDNGWVWH